MVGWPARCCLRSLLFHRLPGSYVIIKPAHVRTCVHNHLEHGMQLTHPVPAVLLLSLQRLPCPRGEECPYSHNVSSCAA
jgi:hypothetical protein